MPEVPVPPAIRYAMKSDAGLSGVVSVDAITRVLSDVAEPDEGVAALVELANRAGGPDNITCIIADVLSRQDPVAETDARAAGSHADILVS